jgi:hypothetical protein
MVENDREARRWMFRNAKILLNSNITIQVVGFLGKTSGSLKKALDSLEVAFLQIKKALTVFRLHLRDTTRPFIPRSSSSLAPLQSWPHD